MMVVLHGVDMQRKGAASIAILLAVLLHAGSSSAQSRDTSTQRLAAGNHEFALRHGGRVRTYIVHVPKRTLEQPPVILAFHGGGGNAAGFQEYAELHAIAEREGFIVVYPNGTGPLPRRLLTWNAGDGCCGHAMTRKVNDVGFATTVLNDLEGRTPIDRGRVYATGHSNGAIMAHRMAAERPELIAAIAPFAGSLDLKNFAPRRGVPVLQIHSVDDPRALYNGGLGPPFPGTNNRVLHQSVQAGLDRWIAVNKCRTRPDTVAVRRGAAGTREATVLAQLDGGTRPSMRMYVMMLP